MWSNYLLILKIYPSKINGVLSVPQSKSYTHRAIILASISEGTSFINNPLISEDTQSTVKICELLGSQIKNHESSLEITGSSVLKSPSQILDVNNSGTTLRLITGIASLIPNGNVTITGDDSIQKRPMGPLLDSLNELGAKCMSINSNNCAPINVKSGGILGGSTEILGNISSQFISSLLICSTKFTKDVTINVKNTLVSAPYVDITLKLLDLFGYKFKNNQYNLFTIPSQQISSGTSIDIPGDFSSAAILIGLAILNNGTLKLTNLNFSLPQADKKIISIVKLMGANIDVDEAGGSITVSNNDLLSGGDFNLSDAPDLFPIVSMLALKSKTSVKITGVGHTRFKESNRVFSILNELKKFGCEVTELDDGVIITPTNSLSTVTLNSFGDHRLFMSLVAAALSTQKICLIDGLEYVNISYPNFLVDLKKIGVKFEVK